MTGFPAPDPLTPKGQRPSPVGVQPDRPEKRVTFERDHTFLPRLKSAQKPGRCCLCGSPLQKGRRFWCTGACYSAAYRASVKRDWDETRQQVLERDKGVCQNCGKLTLRTDLWARNPDDRAEVDHIVPVLDAPERQYDLDNLRTLCGKCHRERHRTGGGNGGGQRPLPPPKQPESVKVGSGPSGGQMPLPIEPAERKKKKEEIETLLLQNWDLPAVIELSKTDGPTVRAIWGVLKEQQRVPRAAKAGFLEGMEPKRLQPQEPKTPPQPQPTLQSQQPQQAQQQYVLQAMPQQGSSQSTQPAVSPQPQPLSLPQSYILVPQQPQAQPQQGLQVMPYNPAPSHDGGAISPRYPVDTFNVEATGMVAKVFNNPKNLMWYDWFKHKSKFEGDYADFIADCLPGDDEIIVLKGGEYCFQPIREVQPGTIVPSYSFEEGGFCFEPVTEKLDKGTRDIWEVKLQNGLSFRCTGNHRLFVYNQHWAGRRIRKLPLSQVVDDHGRILHQNRSNRQLVSALQLPELNGEGNPAKLWLQGLWVADGWRMKRGKRGQYIGGGNIKLFDEALFREFTAKLGRLGLPRQGRRSGKGWEAYLPKHVLDGVAREDAHGKRFPVGASALKRELVSQLVEGYAAGDGHDGHGYRGKPKRTFVTVSPRLADELLTLHLVLGRPLWYRTFPEGERRFPNGNVSHTSGGFSLEDADHWFSRPIGPGISKTPIRSVEKVGQERVYDINVMGTHNFVLKSGAIVHNCIEDFFKSRGWQIVFTKQEKVS